MQAAIYFSEAVSCKLDCTVLAPCIGMLQLALASDTQHFECTSAEANGTAREGPAQLAKGPCRRPRQQTRPAAQNCQKPWKEARRTTSWGQGTDSFAMCKMRKLQPLLRSFCDRPRESLAGASSAAVAAGPSLQIYQAPPQYARLAPLPSSQATLLDYKRLPSESSYSERRR